MLRALSGTLGNRNLHQSFLPSTVSELVSEWQSVEARIFFGFELLAVGRGTEDGSKTVRNKRAWLLDMEGSGRMSQNNGHMFSPESN